MAKTTVTKNLVNEVLTRAVEKIYPSQEVLEKTLLSGKRLRIYLGIDPTGPHLHLGHLTNLLVLKRFQNLGHEIIFLIGDFTAMIGDPSDKLAPRQPLTRAQVLKNLKTFKAQASRILKFTGAGAAKIDFNSRWHSKMKAEDLLNLAQNFTVQQLIQRDMFQERLKHNKPFNLKEFFYPLMQGYDSVALDVDMEIGGTDQTFNMLVGRDLMKIYKHKEKFVLTTKLLENPKTGKKLMNKSEGGLINLDDSPQDIFGKVMALDDAAILPVAEFSTEIPVADLIAIKKEVQTNPRDAKIRVAQAVVETIYDKSAAQKSKTEFIKIFAKKGKPENIKKARLGVNKIGIVELLAKTGLASSKSEARRLIQQGAVKINDAKKTDPHEIISLKPEILLQVGPRRFLRVKA